MLTRSAPLFAGLLVSLYANAALASKPGEDENGDLQTVILHGQSGRQIAGQGVSRHGPTGPDGTGEFIQTGNLPEGDAPSAVVFTPDGTQVVVAHRDTMDLTVLDAATRAHVQTITLSGSPNDVAITPDGTRAVTANLWEDTASVVDLGTGTEVAVIPVGDQPGLARITPDGQRAVIGNMVDQSFSVLDLTALVELRQIAGAGFSSITTVTFESGAISFRFGAMECVDNDWLIHPDNVNATIDFFNLNTGAVTSLPATNRPRGLAVTPDRSTAVVCHDITEQTLTVIDTASQSITKTINVGTTLGQYVTIAPDGSKAAVAIQNAVVIVDLVTSAVSAPISTSGVNGLATTADGNYALAVTYKGSLISYATETVVAELNNTFNAYLGAVSPVDARGVLIANQNAEDALFVDTSGAAGTLEGIVPTGAPPEADRTRKLAMSPDSARVVTTNILSHNASAVDLQTRTVEWVTPTGLRPADVEITPDGTRAVIANLDSADLTIVDLATGVPTTVALSTRPSEVEVSPDGRYAYVAVVSSGDGVWRVDLTVPAIAGPRLLTGNMGSVGYLFWQASGLTLSHDGQTLVTCDSFDNTVTLVDTATWSVVKTLAVGSFPARATFSPDDDFLYVANRDSDNVSVIANAGAGSAVLTTIPVGNQPFEMTVSPDGGRLFVANFQDASVDVVNTATSNVIATLPVPNSPQAVQLSPDGAELFVSSGFWSVSVGPGPKVQINLDGELSVFDTASLSVLDQTTTGEPPAMAALGGCGSIATCAVPFAGGLMRVDRPAVALRLSASQPRAAAGDYLTLGVCHGQPGALGLLALIDFGGVPLFQVLSVRTFRPDSILALTAPVPPGLAGFDATFLGFGRGPSGKLEASNTTTVQFE